VIITGHRLGHDTILVANDAISVLCREFVPWRWRGMITDMGRLFPLLFLIQIALAVFALIGCLSAEEGEIRGLPRIGWIVVILLFPLVGPIAWFLAGRPVSAARRPHTWRPGSGSPGAQRPRRPVAPDDDPEFLRSIKRDDQELFQRWEEDLRKREDDLRKREQKRDDEQ
jgi:hypothetical protein